MEIFYIGFYNPKDKINNDRELFPAAQTKMYSIIEMLEELNYKIHLISMNSTIGKNNEKSVFMSITDKVDLKFFYAFSKRNKLYQILNFVYLRMQFFFYILFHVKKDDNVIVYHSLIYLRLIKYLKKIIGFNLILEMEEIYSDVMNDDQTKCIELDYAKMADAYIFPTVMLNEKVNFFQKPYVIMHGTYTIEYSREKLFKDDKIHIIYAGTLDPRKGGALSAIEVGKYLPKEYHVHILGFGSQEEINFIKNKIQTINAESTATISYDGLLSGEDFIRFVQSCDIGLSTQNPNASFNDSSFPSKILMYLSNGLRVVTVKIPVIRSSKVNSIVYYYNEQSPKEIAKTIRSINIDASYNSRELIKRLRREFKADLDAMLKGLDRKCF